MPSVQNEIRAIEALNTHARTLLRRFREESDGGGAAGELIYHYTNDDGLHGIIGTGKLWLSNVFKLNDPSELKYGLNIRCSCLEEQSLGDGPDIRRFVETVRRFTEEGLPSSVNSFACSLSLDGDHLGQWRAYGDNGSGFALGFDSSDLVERFAAAARPDRASPDVIRIRYCEAELADAQRDLAAFALNAARKIVDVAHAPEKTAIRFVHFGTVLSIWAIQLSLFFKHPAYRDEQEFRLLQLYPLNGSVPGAKARRRAYALVEYVEFDWRSADLHSLKKIVVGPANRERGVQFAHDCLKAAGLTGVEILPSPIPYRAG